MAYAPLAAYALKDRLRSAALPRMAAKCHFAMTVTRLERIALLAFRFAGKRWKSLLALLQVEIIHAAQSGRFSAALHCLSCFKYPFTVKEHPSASRAVCRRTAARRVLCHAAACAPACHVLYAALHLRLTFAGKAPKSWLPCLGNAALFQHIQLLQLCFRHFLHHRASAVCFLPAQRLRASAPAFFVGDIAIIIRIALKQAQPAKPTLLFLPFRMHFNAQLLLKPVIKPACRWNHFTAPEKNDKFITIIGNLAIFGRTNWMIVCRLGRFYNVSSGDCTAYCWYWKNHTNPESSWKYFSS